MMRARGCFHYRPGAQNVQNIQSPELQSGNKQALPALIMTSFAVVVCQAAVRI